MNNKIYLPPTRSESRERVEFWEGKYNELVKKLGKYKNETMIMRRKLRKWKFYFWGLFSINVFTLIYLIFIK